MKSSFKESVLDQLDSKHQTFFFLSIRIFQPLGAFLNNTRAASWSLLDRRWTRKTWWMVKEGLVSQYYLCQSLWYDRSTGRESIPHSVCCTVSYLLWPARGHLVVALWNAHSIRSHNCFSLESFVHSGYFTCTCTAKFQFLGRRLCREFKLILIRFLLCIFSSIRLYTKCVTTKDWPIWFFQGRHQCRLLVIK